MAKLAEYGIRDGASIEEMRKELARAGKAANQRLRRLETAASEGRTTGKGMSYSYAMNYLGKMGRTRFKERVKNLTAQQVQQELAQVNAFLSGRQSTVTGVKRSEKRRYKVYKDEGYVGTFEQFRQDVQLVFAFVNENQFSSDIGYEMLTSGGANVVRMLNKARNQAEKGEEQGRILLDILRRKRKTGGKNHRRGG